MCNDPGLNLLELFTSSFWSIRFFDRNHLLSEYTQWNYASFNVKISRLTSKAPIKLSNCRNTLYVATHHMSFPSLKQSRTYLMHDHGILRHCITPLALDNWGQKYCQTLGYKPNPSIPQCNFQCWIRLLKILITFKKSSNT